MARKLPHLDLLHLFEAASRNLSFKKAAEELFLTPSAISHQVKSLEETADIHHFATDNKQNRPSLRRAA
jgi:LysR family glycine cleavage system transcriptional activator